MHKYVLFVGDKPSKKNKNKDVAFVGTKSYKTLLDWIYQLDVSIMDAFMCNTTDSFDKYSEGYEVNTGGHTLWIHDKDAIIALGENASKHLSSLGIGHFVMPHPSGLNRKLNDKKWLKKKLKECKRYIHK